jgi:hypothetical protein
MWVQTYWLWSLIAIQCFTHKISLYFLDAAGLGAAAAAGLDAAGFLVANG